MSKVLEEFPSLTKPGRIYKITEGDDGVVYCDCWQWKINKTCKHLEIHKGRKIAHATTDTYQVRDLSLQQTIDAVVSMLKGDK